MPVIIKAEGNICDDGSDAIVSDVCCSGALNGPLHNSSRNVFPSTKKIQKPVLKER